MRILLLGGTDLTQAVADTLVELAMPPVGVVFLEKTLSISIRPQGMENRRHTDMPGWCRCHGVPASSYRGVDALMAFSREVSAEFCLAAGWYYFLPARVRDLYPKGCAGLHASLLPQLRGSAPLNWAILTGLDKTGISLFQLTEGMDEGPLLGQKVIPIPDGAYVGDLLPLVEQGAKELLQICLPRVRDETLVPMPQQGKVSYGLQRNPEDGCILWDRPAREIACLIRAVSRPYPGALTSLEGERITVWRGSEAKDAPRVWGRPGQILHLSGYDVPLVVTGEGLLRLEEAERAGHGDALPWLKTRNQWRFSAVFPSCQ
ncbi:MAG: methionyl-tRNA formyltransferase [Magnetococcales bacterium]|nr:methionyl-tRNA formyltransferase [Magnetococcales bacterium]